MVTNEQIKSLIETGIPHARATVTSDGRHFEVVIISEEFNNQDTLTRHRLVFSTLGDRMESEIHAMSLHTFTQEEYNKKINDLDRR